MDSSDLVVPIASDHILRAVIYLVVWCLVPTAFVTVFKVLVRPDRRRFIRALVWAILIAVAGVPFFANFQTGVTVNAGTVVIRYFLTSDEVVKSSEVDEIVEDHQKSVTSLMLITAAGRKHPIDVAGSQLNQVGNQVAEKLGLTSSPSNGLERWIRPARAPNH